ncbi:hypothetical protein [Streptomyces clavuligerus]|uniref:hypothetical protein n=1 Tax=Streptomyces clavuligerus TaxID=1901 RepID=UPI00018515BF|nr:hypothetical protein [Streptomyces clavuligerus]AXU16851.1 integrase, catalytic region [Streptomyces clavuligerus]MBY6300985.1 integrase, catalytic region [Streptomyces clavuligerus]QPJ97004.1 integrase, catalytic region [Streptomyces clavuligerus]WDN55795.1 integrase, catalytic region [Streptomyces clavuligerus]
MIGDGGDVGGVGQVGRPGRGDQLGLHDQGVALDASLCTAAPLLGAGLDRIVHAFYTETLDPLDLAARAEVAMQLVDGETGLSTVDLLEPPH